MHMTMQTEDNEGFVTVQNYQVLSNGIWKPAPGRHRTISSISCGAGRVWVTKWIVDNDVHADDNGWQYSQSLDGTYTPDPRGCVFRRRRHFRQWRTLDKLDGKYGGIGAAELVLKMLAGLSGVTILFRLLLVPSTRVYTYSRWSEDAALVFVLAITAAAIAYAMRTALAPTIGGIGRGLDSYADLTQPTDMGNEPAPNPRVETLKPPTGLQSLSSPRARAKKLLAAATNTSLTALAELADYGLKTASAADKSQGSASSETFVFVLTLADGSRRQVSATLGDIWSLYVKVSFTPQLSEAARPVSPRMALAKRLITSQAEELDETKRSSAEQFARDVLIGCPFRQQPKDVRDFFDLRNVWADVVDVQCRIQAHHIDKDS